MQKITHGELWTDADKARIFTFAHIHNTVYYNRVQPDMDMGWVNPWVGSKILKVGKWVGFVFCYTDSYVIVVSLSRC